MNAEKPRGENAIRSKLQLVRALRFEKYVKRNMNREPPLRTILDIIVDALLPSKRRSGAADSCDAASAAVTSAPQSPVRTSNASPVSPKGTHGNAGAPRPTPAAPTQPPARAPSQPPVPSARIPSQPQPPVSSARTPSQPPVGVPPTPRASAAQPSAPIAPASPSTKRTVSARPTQARVSPAPSAPSASSVSAMPAAHHVPEPPSASVAVKPAAPPTRPLDRPMGRAPRAVQVQVASQVPAPARPAPRSFFAPQAQPAEGEAWSRPAPRSFFAGPEGGPSAPAPRGGTRVTLQNLSRSGKSRMHPPASDSVPGQRLGDTLGSTVSTDPLGSTVDSQPATVGQQPSAWSMRASGHSGSTHSGTASASASASRPTLGSSSGPASRPSLGVSSSARRPARSAFMADEEEDEEGVAPPHQLALSSSSSSRKSNTASSAQSGTTGTRFSSSLSSVHSARPTTASRSRADAEGDGLVLEDVSDDESPSIFASHKARPQIQRGALGTSLPAASTRLDGNTMHELLQLLLGDRARFPDGWMQGFSFSPVPVLSYGLVQQDGGPCGIIASVQATLLSLAMAGHTHPRDAPPDTLWRFDTAQQTDFLCRSLARILWRVASPPGAACDEDDETEAELAHQKHRCLVVTISGSADPKSHMPPAHACRLLEFDSYAALTQAFRAYLSQFAGPWGVVLYLLSAVLTHGVERTRREMDLPASLITNYGYCAQELVNLFLVGESCTNVFDGERHMDEMRLGGIRRRPTVGYLTLFESYGYCEVGTFYKRPCLPLWVVCSESHYSVLFARSKAAFAVDTRAAFDLVYYDPLGAQDEEYRLTVDPQGSLNKRGSGGSLFANADLEPPMERVIRTRWPRAGVDWNGSDPLL